MRVLVAPNALKEGLSNVEAAEALKKGVLKAAPQCEVFTFPLSDGGDNLLKTFQALNPEMKEVYLTASDAAGRTIKTLYLADGKGTAVIETSLVAGLAQLNTEMRNPMKTSTYGLGEVIRHALSNGCRRIVTGIGGSATVDGGAGMGEALGFRFLNRRGEALSPAGGNLNAVESIDDGDLFPGLRECSFQVVCDVDNPLLGPRGAAPVFAPQKGATEKDVPELDRNLRHFAQLTAKKTGENHSHFPGAGAAGGLGFFFKSFFKADLIPGSQLVIRESGLEKLLPKTDLVLTAEGSLDAQSVHGKIPGVLSEICKRHGVPCVALAGQLGPGYHQLYPLGLTSAFAIAPGPVTLEESLKRSAELLESAAQRVMRLFLGRF